MGGKKSINKQIEMLASALFRAYVYKLIATEFSGISGSMNSV